ncbi:MAG: chaperonin GroEL [Lachnospiraceae bacterium]|nr:chaperonin GroEL [Lachnospiraceae bacterium]
MPLEILRDMRFLENAIIGVDMLADAVKTSLGPAGRNTLLPGSPHLPPVVSSSGASIAKEIEPGDAAGNLGVRTIREAAAKMNEETGDGTTTAAILAQCILREGYLNAAAGANTIELRKGILKAARICSGALTRLSIPADTDEKLTRIAVTGAGDAGLGAMVARAFIQAGPDGIVTVEESNGTDTVLDARMGMHFDRGWLAPEFATDEKGTTARLEDPYVLVTDRSLTDATELLPVVEQVAAAGGSLFIVAEEVQETALGLLVVNAVNGALRCVAIHPPAYGDGRIARMEDLAVMTGGTFFSKVMGYATLRGIRLEQLGRAGSVTVTARNTQIVGGAGEEKAVAAWANGLKTAISRTDYDFAREQLKERLAKFAGGVAVIKVGAYGEAEMKEKKQRAQDALHALQAAAAEGIVPGGGIAYLRIMPAAEAFAATLDGDERTGARIILKALEAPTRQIAANAGLDGGAVVAKILSMPGGTGYDAAKGEYANMMDAGVVDSVKVTRLALLTAASAASTLLTAGAGAVRTAPPPSQ